MARYRQAMYQPSILPLYPLAQAAREVTYGNSEILRTNEKGTVNDGH